MSKKYGLIVPNKTKLTPANVIKKPSIFDEESDTEEETERPTGITTAIKRQDRIAQEKAVEEDPTVYQYDEIYDKMEQERIDTKISKRESEKKPKYITRLLAAAEKRKRENERRIERQVQKEREAEGDEFNDKESFVTAAYKKKLEDFKKLEEEERREEYLESIGDVTKQGNLDGFYRHLYSQKVNREKFSDEEEKPIAEETKTEEQKIPIKHVSHKRAYRKRDSSGSEDNEKEEKKLAHLPSNIDADSDFSIDSDSEGSDDDEMKSKEIKVEDEKDKGKVVEEKAKEEPTTIKVEEDKGDDKGENVVKEAEEVKPKKPKIDIWKKRTVGVVFDEALQRYFERKALREAAK